MSSKPQLSWYDYRSLLETIQLQALQIDTLEQRLRQAFEAAGKHCITVEASPGSLANPRIYDTPPSRRDAGAAAAWWPRAAGDPPALQPNPGWANFVMKAGLHQVIAYSVCGFDRATLADILSTVAKQHQADGQFLPVFLTDSTEFDLFRTHGFVFEYFPGPEKWTAVEGTKPWAERAADRLAHVQRKWAPVRIVQFGPHPFPRLQPIEESAPCQLGPRLIELDSTDAAAGPEAEAETRPPADARAAA